MSQNKEHVRKSDVALDGSCIAMCGAAATRGNWKAGAAFEGLRILGMEANEFCPECSRAWISLINRRDTP